MKLVELKGFYDENITITITSEPCTIGRSRTVDFIIPHVNVSRNHCEIFKENTSWKISDYSSSGTFINDLLIGKGKSVFINNGDHIRFGPIESKLCWTFCSFDSSSGNINSSNLGIERQTHLVSGVKNKNTLLKENNHFKDTVNHLNQPYEKKESDKGSFNFIEVTQTEINSKNEVQCTVNNLPGGRIISNFKKEEKCNDKSTSEKIQELKKELHQVQSALNEIEEKNCAPKEELTVVPDSNFLENLTNLMETEFQCTICSELFLIAVTLSCTHTFCKYCIDQWKKKQRTCPICRKKITNETRSLVVDNYIDKIIENLSLELKERRETILKERNETETFKKRSKFKTKNSVKNLYPRPY